MMDDYQIRTIKFSDIIPDKTSEKLDCFLEMNGWQLQEWTRKGFLGYNIFYGKGTQVNNRFEYEFPYLFSKDELFDCVTSWNIPEPRIYEGMFRVVEDGASSDTARQDLTPREKVFE